MLQRATFFDSAVDDRPNELRATVRYNGFFIHVALASAPLELTKNPVRAE